MKIRHAVIAFAAAAPLVLSLAGAASAAPAAASSGNYGSFAYSPAKASIVAKGFGSTALKAEDAAEAQCEKHAKDCLPVVWFEHAYATFEVGPNHAWAWGASPTSAGADHAADSWCSTHGGGKNCRVVLRAVTTAPSSSAIGTDLRGRMCMVNAPTGVISIDGHNIIGHVGWAYLKNRDTGLWEYGANEGPVSIIHLDWRSKTWVRDGTWTKLVVAFAKDLGKGKEKTYFHKAGFYTSIRCSSQAGFTSDAHAKAESQQNKKYSYPDNDCLSNAVDVLVADGNPGLADALSPLQNTLPNWYYAHGLSNFSPKVPL